jgi:spermidine synthase
LVEDLEDNVHWSLAKSKLYRGRTRYAEVEIADTVPFGKVLTLDGFVQSAELDEVAYHESLVVPASLMARATPRTVLILGGGEGAVLREVMRIEGLQRCVMVDLDEELVQLCREHLPEWSAGAFDDSRAEVHFGDARAHVEQLSPADRFDLIIADLPDGEMDTPLQDLYSLEFYQVVRRHLSPDGVFVTQAHEPLFAESELIDTPWILATVAAAFDDQAHVMARFLPSFWSEWAFVVAGPGLERAPVGFTAGDIDARLHQRRVASFPCQTYDGETHVHMAHLTMDVRAQLTRDAFCVRDRTMGGHTPSEADHS